MTDIVWKLRNDVPCISDIGCAWELCNQAADEIERLRAVLTKADKLYRICDGEIPEPENIKAVWDDTKASVRAALEGK